MTRYSFDIVCLRCGCGDVIQSVCSKGRDDLEHGECKAVHSWMVCAECGQDHGLTVKVDLVPKGRGTAGRPIGARQAQHARDAAHGPDPAAA